MLDFDFLCLKRIFHVKLNLPHFYVQHVVPVGYSELSVMRRNDAESLIVRPGCKFVGESASIISFVKFLPRNKVWWTNCKPTQ